MPRGTESTAGRMRDAARTYARGRAVRYRDRRTLTAIPTGTCGFSESPTYTGPRLSPSRGAPTGGADGKDWGASAFGARPTAGMGRAGGSIASIALRSGGEQGARPRTQAPCTPSTYTAAPADEPAVAIGLAIHLNGYRTGVGGCFVYRGIHGLGSAHCHGSLAARQHAPRGTGRPRARRSARGPRSPKRCFALFATHSHAQGVSTPWSHWQCVHASELQACRAPTTRLGGRLTAACQLRRGTQQ